LFRFKTLVLLSSIVLWAEMANHSITICLYPASHPAMTSADPQLVEHTTRLAPTVIDSSTAVRHAASRNDIRSLLTHSHKA